MLETFINFVRYGELYDSDIIYEIISKHNN